MAGDTMDGTQALPTQGRLGRDSLEFARVANLADAVFAIALTLLVLTLDVPAVAEAELDAELVATLPQLVAALLAFALVASIWWQHHRVVARLAFLDRGGITLTLVLLAAVALVPFPTAVLGSYPTSRAAVLPFVGAFVVIHAVFTLLVDHAHRHDAWVAPLSDETHRWVVRGYLLTLTATVVAGLVALVAPVVGLVLLACSNVPERLLARAAPADYEAWA
jgi:uncharacterized membrane protein